ncbi:MAG: S8 family serine peptidase, partial [Geopsychrobacter sp.]|nr:S8 family serine peptidase [Geopsychrobacter sp.]
VLDPGADPETDDSADIVNNSWGFDLNPGQCLTDPQIGLTNMQVALTNLIAADVAVVFSAGNTGPLSGSSIPPGNMSGVLAVGAVDFNRDIAFFSARGPSPCDAPGEVFPRLVAPGVAVRSAGLTSGYVNVDGTSFSAPQVAGALALLRQAFPAPTSMTDLESAMQQVSVDLGVQGDDNDYGSGLLAVDAAYNLLLPNSAPVLFISDPVPPANDGIIDFASVGPLKSRSLSLELKNGGSSILASISFDTSALNPVFTLANDQCTGRTLTTGASCSVDLVFTPTVLGSIALSDLSINSNDPAGSQVVHLSGIGNNAPPVASLLQPADGALDITRPVLFGWQRQADLDGDVVNDFLLLSELGDFSDSTPITAALPQGLVLLAGGGFFWGLWRSRRDKGWMLLALFLGLALLQVSCGGGGSASPAAAPVLSGEYQSTGLLPNTVYYWKVRSEDSRGGVSESAVRSFTTGP